MSRPLIALALVAPIALVAPAFAGAPQAQPFDQAAFEAAQAAGKPILIDVHAPWCPVCAAQQRVIAATVKDPRYANLVIFRIDFDSQKALWQRFGATKQSTLIGFHGRTETGRVIYSAETGKVQGLLASTLG